MARAQLVVERGPELLLNRLVPLQLQQSATILQPRVAFEEFEQRSCDHRMPSLERSTLGLKHVSLVGEDCWLDCHHAADEAVLESESLDVSAHGGESLHTAQPQPCSPRRGTQVEWLESFESS